MARHELKHLEAAVAVAEELSFSRAAKRLHLSQPAVTKYIADLEDLLGVTLFNRDRHVVSLTEAGRAYVEEARKALLHAERAVQVSRAAGQNAEAVLNVGKSPYADPFFTSLLLASKLPLFPRLKLHLSSGFSCDLTHQVLTGELDLAIAIEPPRSGRLTSLTIDESPIYLVMPRDDRLASEPAVALEQLAGRRWILFQRSAHPLIYDLIHQLAREKKTIPAGLQHFMVPEETIPLLNEPGGVVILPKSGALRIARDGLTMRPFTDPSLMMKTLLVSRSDNESPVLSELVRSLVRRMNHMKAVDQMSLPIPV